MKVSLEVPPHSTPKNISFDPGFKEIFNLSRSSILHPTSYRHLSLIEKSLPKIFHTISNTLLLYRTQTHIHFRKHVYYRSYELGLRRDPRW